MWPKVTQKTTTWLQWQTTNLLWILMWSIDVVWSCDYNWKLDIPNVKKHNSVHLHESTKCSSHEMANINRFCSRTVTFITIYTAASVMLTSARFKLVIIFSHSYSTFILQLQLHLKLKFNPSSRKLTLQWNTYTW